MKLLLKKFYSTILFIPGIKYFLLFLMSHVTHRRQGIPDALGVALKYKPLIQVGCTKSATPLASSCVALVTTAGYYVKGQEPFAEHRIGGDFSYRSIPKDMPLPNLVPAQYTIDRRTALLDANTLFPIDRLKELKAQGYIREVANTHYSFYSYSSSTNRVREGSAKDVARRLRYEGVDKAIIMTATPLSQEIAFLVQRSIEEEGIQTVSIGYSQHAIEALKPPRTCILTRGALCRLDEYLDVTLQMNLLTFLLSQFNKIHAQNSIEKIVNTVASIDPMAKPVIQTRLDKSKIQRDLFE